MMCSNFCPAPNSPSGLDSDCSSSKVNVQALDNNLFADDMASRQQKSDDDAENPKQTMESLCKSFIKKYEHSEALFEPTELANDFNAKLRRVYDMTNILEGGGIIEKVEKGSYKWSSQSNEDKEIYTEKNDWYCLRNISSELKELFESSDKGLTCHEIYQILTTQRKGKLNPTTIRRRIYECCKVFSIAGLVQKIGKSFYNAKLTHQDIQLLASRHRLNLQDKNQFENGNKSKQQKTEKSSPRKSIKLVQKNSQNEVMTFPKVKQERESLIKKIVSELKNEQDLIKFIKDLTLEFKSKKSQTQNVSEDDKMDEQSEFLSPNNYSWLQSRKMGFVKRRQSQETYFSPQNNRRTIIISSPMKDKVSFMFSPNSSFCSFPSSQNLGSLCNLKPAFDIKGN